MQQLVEGWRGIVGTTTPDELRILEAGLAMVAPPQEEAEADQLESFRAHVSSCMHMRETVRPIGMGEPLPAGSPTLIARSNMAIAQKACEAFLAGSPRYRGSRRDRKLARAMFATLNDNA